MANHSKHQSFTLSNKSGNKVELLNFGATLQSLTIKDKIGHVQDIILGYDEGSSYARESRNYFGATIGRIAGRVSKGGYAYNGQYYPLEQNHGPYHIHGGVDAMSHQFWKGEHQKIHDQEQVVFTYQSPDGENGYPGNLSVCVTYAWTNDNHLRILIEAQTDQTTPLAMTNHAYFNLNGTGSRDIQNLILQIEADHCMAVHPDLGHTGEIIPVEGLPDDFRSPLHISERLMELHKSHGSMYVFQSASTFGKRATLTSLNTGIQMEVWSNQKYMQFYTGEHLSDISGKKGAVYGSFAGACFECQGYPDALNFPDFDSIFLNPGVIYNNQTEYRFSILS